jgi:hypothetical protein
MAGNPLVPQGILNRVSASVVWTNFPQLNVTAPYLDKDGISLRMTSKISTRHPTMTGVVQSPEPYVEVELVIAMLRTQALANAYKIQWEAYSVLADGVVYPDVPVNGIGQFQLENMSIDGVGDLLFNGTTPMFGVSLGGFYLVNSQLFA